MRSAVTVDCPSRIYSPAVAAHSRWHAARTHARPRVSSCPLVHCAGARQARAALPRSPAPRADVAHCRAGRCTPRIMGRAAPGSRVAGIRAVPCNVGTGDRAGLRVDDSHQPVGPGAEPPAARHHPGPARDGVQPRYAERRVGLRSRCAKTRRPYRGEARDTASQGGPSMLVPQPAECHLPGHRAGNRGAEHPLRHRPVRDGSQQRMPASAPRRRDPSAHRGRRVDVLETAVGAQRPGCDRASARQTATVTGSAGWPIALGTGPRQRRTTRRDAPMVLDA